MTKNSAPIQSRLKSFSTSIANAVSKVPADEAQVSFVKTMDIDLLTGGRISQNFGEHDGWPSNDVPLVVMYSPNMTHLTEMRRLIQSSGIRFLGYDRVDTLMDALAVLNPSVIMISENDGAVAHRVGRQVMADDYNQTLIRVVEVGAATQSRRAPRQAVGGELAFCDAVDGPFVASMPLDVTVDRMLAVFGRVGVLPRRLGLAQ